MKEIEDGATLQLGIGALPNLMGQLIAESDLKNIGMHTEMRLIHVLISMKRAKLPVQRKISTTLR
jgi:acyl-CoA hydrolase